MRVISASRRTDIPAFYSPWLLRRLRDGFCHTVNPHTGAVGRVSLASEDVLAVGLFTRDPRPLMPALPVLMERGLRFYAHMTINGYPRSLEPRSPDMRSAVSAFADLSSALGSGFTVWRYDPIVLGAGLDAAYHVERFSRIAAELEGRCHRCVISFVDPYAKTVRNLPGAVDWQVGERHVELAARLASIGLERGIRVCSCAEPALADAGVAEGACVDPALIAALRPDAPVRLRLAATREGCLCHQATDIGAYHTCAFGCAYCYATDSPALGAANRALHDPRDTILLRPPQLRGVDLDTLVDRGREPGPDASQPGLFG